MKRTKHKENNGFNFWERINTDEEHCFVCEKKFKNFKRKVYIGLHPHTKKRVYRHSKCNCFSPQWKKKFPDYEPFNGKYKSKEEQNGR